MLLLILLDVLVPHQTDQMLRLAGVRSAPPVVAARGCLATMAAPTPRHRKILVMGQMTEVLQIDSAEGELSLAGVAGHCQAAARRPQPTPHLLP